MNEPADPPPKKTNKVGFIVGGVLLLVTAVLPPDIAWFTAGVNVFLLWIVFGIPMARSFTHNSTGGGETLLFGLFGVLLAGVGAILLVGVSCAAPMSRFNPH